eukprot:scaffold3065_cov389-Prasinococcus_capsulatus_cf.AAC.25
MPAQYNLRTGLIDVWAMLSVVCTYGYAQVTTGPSDTEVVIKILDEVQSKDWCHGAGGTHAREDLGRESGKAARYSSSTWNMALKLCVNGSPCKRLALWALPSGQVQYQPDDLVSVEDPTSNLGWVRGRSADKV